MPHPDQPATSRSDPTVSRRAVFAGTGIMAVSAAIAGCSTYGTGTAPNQPPATAPGPPPSPEAAPPPADAGQGDALASTADIPVGGGQVFADEQVVVTRPEPDQYRAFSAVCTHQGCTVQGVSGGTINCACHGSQFNSADGSVVTGPATAPLQSREAVVEGGSIRVR